MSRRLVREEHRRFARAYKASAGSARPGGNAPGTILGLPDAAKILIGGQRSQISRASFNPSMEPGIWISVKTAAISDRLWRITTAASAFSASIAAKPRSSIVSTAPSLIIGSSSITSMVWREALKFPIEINLELKLALMLNPVHGYGSGTMLAKRLSLLPSLIFCPVRAPDFRWPAILRQASRLRGSLVCGRAAYFDDPRLDLRQCSWSSSMLLASLCVQCQVK